MLHLPLVLPLLVALSPTAVAQAPLPAPVPVLNQAPLPVPQEVPGTVEMAPVHHQLVLEQPAFGQRGQLVAHGLTSGTVYGEYVKEGAAKANTFAFDIQLRAGGFVANHFLLLGAYAVDFQYGSGFYNVTTSVGPIAGIYAPIAPHWGFLPNLGVIYQFARAHTSAGSQDNHQVHVRLHLDTVVHLTQHASVTVGPFVDQTVYDYTKSFGDSWVTVYGISAGILAWK